MIQARAAFRYPNYRCYMSARFLTPLASEMQAVAVAWQVYALTHRPLELVIIFLGTNDLADRYSLPPLDIARGAALLAQIALRSETGPGYGAPAVLLCSLPRLGDTSTLADTFSGGAAKAADLSRYFQVAATEVGVPLLDLSEVTVYDDADGVHLNAGGHRAVALAVARVARELLGY